MGASESGHRQLIRQGSVVAKIFGTKKPVIRFEFPSEPLLEALHRARHRILDDLESVNGLLSPADTDQLDSYSEIIRGQGLRSTTELGLKTTETCDILRVEFFDILGSPVPSKHPLVETLHAMRNPALLATTPWTIGCLASAERTFDENGDKGRSLKSIVQTQQIARYRTLLDCLTVSLVSGAEDRCLEFYQGNGLPLIELLRPPQLEFLAHVFERLSTLMEYCDMLPASWSQLRKILLSRIN